MFYKASLRQAGNSIEVNLEATSPKEALEKAHKAADSLFDYTAFDVLGRPTVAIREIKEKEEKE